MEGTKVAKQCRNCFLMHEFHCKHEPIKPDLRVVPCKCGKPITHIFYPYNPTRFNLLEID